MRGLVGAVATIVIGTIVVRLVHRGDHLAYVKDSLTLPLLVAAAVLVLVGGFHWWRELAALGRDQHGRVEQGPQQHLRPRHGEHQNGRHGHGEQGDGGHREGGHGEGEQPHGRHRHDRHRHGPESWALLGAFALLAAIPPTPLGPGSAPQLDRASDFAARSYAPLADGAVHAMPLREYWERAHFDTDRSLQGKVVRLVGFVARPGATSTYGEVASPEPTAGPTATASSQPGPGSAPDDGWTLTRMSIACCAADAVAVRVRVVTAAPGGVGGGPSAGGTGPSTGGTGPSTGGGGPRPGAMRPASPAPGQWVAVEGTWAPQPGSPAGPPLPPLPPPVIVAATVTPIPAPRSPYE